MEFAPVAFLTLLVAIAGPVGITLGWWLGKRSERERTAQILSNLRGRSVLTVSDIEGFAGLGGMVELFTERSKIRMRINLEAVKAANLKISSKLLRVAELTH